MGKAVPSKMLVPIYHIWHHILEDCKLFLLKSVWWIKTMFQTWLLNQSISQQTKMSWHQGSTTQCTAFLSACANNYKNINIKCSNIWLLHYFMNSFNKSYVVLSGRNVGNYKQLEGMEETASFCSSSVSQISWPGLDPRLQKLMKPFCLEVILNCLYILCFNICCISLYSLSLKWDKSNCMSHIQPAFSVFTCVNQCSTLNCPLHCP
jgi:hypothetical protein